MDEVVPDSAATQELLREAGAGSAQAYDRLFARHRARLHEFVALRLDPRLRPRIDADDVVQETQLEAFRRLSEFLTQRPMPRVWSIRTSCPSTASAASAAFTTTR